MKGGPEQVEAEKDLLALLGYLKGGRDYDQEALDLIDKNPFLLTQTYKTMTPLMVAASSPNPCGQTLFNKLLEGPSDVTAKNAKGFNVIHLLAQNNKFEMLNTVLVVKKESIALDDKTKDESTAAYLASLSGSPEALALLIVAGANINIQGNRVQQRQPLHVACLRGDEMCVRLLLLANADVNASDSEGKTPAHYLAASKAPDETKEKILAMLQEKGASLDMQSSKGRTPSQIKGISTAFTTLLEDARKEPLYLMADKKSELAVPEAFLEKIEKLSINKP